MPAGLQRGRLSGERGQRKEADWKVIALVQLGNDGGGDHKRHPCVPWALIFQSTRKFKRRSLALSSWGQGWGPWWKYFSPGGRNSVLTELSYWMEIKYFVNVLLSDPKPLC